MTLLVSAPAQAVLVSFAIDKDSIDPFDLGVTKTNNDCSGYFGSGFNNCMIAFGDTDLSPVIIKFNEDLTLSTDDDFDPTDPDDSDDSGEINTLFPTVDGSEWSFSGTGSENGTGSWEYTTDDDDDPGIRYWVAKAGPGFNIFWDVDQDDFDNLCDGSENTLACLMAANSVTSGTWFTPLNQDGGNRGLSHLTFYDSAPSPIPVPAAFWLFGTALVGFIGISRRRSV